MCARLLYSQIAWERPSPLLSSASNGLTIDIYTSVHVDTSNTKYLKFIYGRKQASNIHTHVDNAVSLVWGTLRLAPTTCMYGAVDISLATWKWVSIHYLLHQFINKHLPHYSDMLRFWRQVSIIGVMIHKLYNEQRSSVWAWVCHMYKKNNSNLLQI